MNLPRLVVAAPATGQGKTTIATGLMAALSRAGHDVSGHKVGPDYIDPGYHALACGRPGRNLDPHLVGEERVVPLLLHGARRRSLWTGAVASGVSDRPGKAAERWHAGSHVERRQRSQGEAETSRSRRWAEGDAAYADVAVIEGVMGLYDGRVGGRGFSSTAHLAALTKSPVVLVVDIARSSRSIGAVVHGMATWDDSIDVKGVILNQAGSPRHVAEVKESIDLPVLGALPRDPDLATPSRHLGLVTAAERDESAAVVELLAEQIAEHIDLDAVLDLARTAPALHAEPWDPASALAAPSPPGVELGASAERGSGLAEGAVLRRSSRRRSTASERGCAAGVPGSTPGRDDAAHRPVVAVAGGRAFTFHYAETTELLEAAGCEVRSFDPATDTGLPEGTAGLYLGGGFPEVHAADLADNAALRAEIRDAVHDGLPTVAECAGLLYLCRTLDGRPMAGAIEADARMSERLTLRYPEATAPTDTLLTRTGERVTGHEFHRTTITPTTATTPAWAIEGAEVGFASESLHASYLHTHWAGHPQLAARFVEAVHARA